MTDWGMIKNHREIWKDIKPQYYYVQEETVQKAETGNSSRYHVRIVLETDYPGIFRVGDLADFPGVMGWELNRKLKKMIFKEKKKAAAIAGLLKEHPEAVEQRIAPLRLEAMETFSLMEEADDGELQNLNQKFYSITEKERQIRHAYSLQNPWLLNFLQIDGELSHESAIAALDHIRVLAKVDDDEWLKSPIYPSAGKYNKGMKDVIGVVTPGGTVTRRPNGRKYRRKNQLTYKEPKLTITNVILIPRYKKYRDYLPTEWMEGRGNIIPIKKKVEECGAKDGKHIRSCLKKEKNRSF